MAVTRPVDPRLRCGRDGQNLLSLDGPAHVFHRALVNEIVNGNHARLGDAVLAAQQAYAFSGHMPEFLGVYNLLGDPGLSVRPEGFIRLPGAGSHWESGALSANTSSST